MISSLRHFKQIPYTSRLCTTTLVKLQQGKNLHTTPNLKDKTDENLSRFSKIKIFMKQYGWIGLGTYWGVWGLTFTGFYTGIKTGAIDYHTWQFLQMDRLEEWYLAIAHKIGIDTDLHPLTENTEDLLVAMMASKVTKPIQMIVTFSITPTISRKLGYAPPKTDSKLDKLKKIVGKINNKE